MQAAERQAEWGCVRPSLAPQLEIECLSCDGSDEHCPECRGTGQLPVHECPRSLMSEWAIEVCRMATVLEHGVLPEAGGMHDQSAPFVDALFVALAQLAHWRNVHHERAARKAEQEARSRGR